MRIVHCRGLEGERDIYGRRLASRTVAEEIDRARDRETDGECFVDTAQMEPALWTVVSHWRD